MIEHDVILQWVGLLDNASEFLRLALRDQNRRDANVNFARIEVRFLVRRMQTEFENQEKANVRD